MAPFPFVSVASTSLLFLSSAVLRTQQASRDGYPSGYEGVGEKIVSYCVQYELGEWGILTC